MNNKILACINKISDNVDISNYKKISMLKKLKNKVIDISILKKNDDLKKMLEEKNRVNENNYVKSDAKVLVKKSGFVSPLVFTLLISIFFCICILMIYILSLI